MQDKSISVWAESSSAAGITTGEAIGGGWARLKEVTVQV